MPRKPHPKQALLEKAAQAKGAKAPATPPAPHIAPLPEGFAIEAPVPSPPASARAKASKRPGREGASSSSRQASPPPTDPQPAPSTFWDFGPPLTMFSGDPDRPPIGALPHPYRRTSSSPAGKDTGKGKGTPTMTYADIANKGKKGKGGKGPKGHKGKTLSERVQDLVNTNDPWEGSGVGPTRWSLPFYGGHVILTHESAACLHHVQHGPATLPVFGGPPCSDISGQAPTTSLTREQPAVAPAQFSPTITCMQLCAICYSPCCLGGTTHGLHACERHRRR